MTSWFDSVVVIWLYHLMWNTMTSLFWRCGCDLSIPSDVKHYDIVVLTVWLWFDYTIWCETLWHRCFDSVVVIWVYHMMWNTMTSWLWFDYTIWCETLWHRCLTSWLWFDYTIWCETLWHRCFDSVVVIWLYHLMWNTMTSLFDSVVVIWLYHLMWNTMTSLCWQCGCELIIPSDLKHYDIVVLTVWLWFDYTNITIYKH